MNKLQKITIYVSQEAREKSLLERLKVVAKAERRSLNWICLEALMLYVQTWEDAGK